MEKIEAISKLQIMSYEEERGIINGTIDNFIKYDGPLDVVVDCGAHVGALSLAAAACGARKVWAIEPDPNSFNILLHNIVNNGFNDIITPLNLALWCFPHIVILHTVNGGNTGMRSILFSGGVVNERFYAPSITLETLFKWVGEPIDYLKIDIEGAEHFLINGETIDGLKNVTCLDIDIHNMDDETFFPELARLNQDEIKRTLGYAGFDLSGEQGHYLVQRGEPIFPERKYFLHNISEHELVNVFNDEEYWTGATSGFKDRANDSHVWRYYRKVADKIMDLNPESVLDVGCGLGYVVKLLADNHIEVCGVDASEWAVNNAFTYIEHGNVISLPYEDKEFDVVFSHDMLEHIPIACLDMVFAELERVGKRNYHIISCGSLDDDEDITHVTMQKIEWWRNHAPEGFILESKGGA